MGGLVAEEERLGQLVMAAWAEVLEIDAVGPEDDFFELGGNSLQAIRIVARLEEDLDLDLSVRAVLETRTVRGMTARIMEQYSLRNTP